MFFCKQRYDVCDVCLQVKLQCAIDILVFLHVFFVDRLKYDVNVFAVFKKDVGVFFVGNQKADV